MNVFLHRLLGSAFLPQHFVPASVATVAPHDVAPRSNGLASSIQRVDATVTGLLIVGFSFGLMMALVGG